MENNLHASKPRGRPLGSKNKRKEPEPSADVQQDGVAMHMKVLEVATGADIIKAVSDFANRFKVDVSVISTYGLVRDLTIYRPQPPVQFPYFVTVGGVFDLLSLKGTFHGSLSSATRPSLVSARHFIYVVDGEENVTSATLAGGLLAATKVFLVVAITRETDCTKLPLTSSSVQDNKLIASSRQPEVCSSARESMSSYGVPSPAPPLRPCIHVANGYLCACGFK